jgi:ribosomal-protein-alanine N-acetyltransferase
MGMLCIRKFMDEDFPQIVRLEYEAFGQQNAPLYVQMYRTCADGFFVADIDGVAAGYVVATFADDGEGRILSIAVDDRFRRKGIAKALLKSAFDFYRRNGVMSVRLEVRTGNVAARELYQRLGFFIVGLIPGYYNDGDAALILRKDISQLPFLTPL